MRKAMAYPCPLCERTSEKKSTAVAHLARAHVGQLIAYAKAHRVAYTARGGRIAPAKRKAHQRK